MKNNLSINKEQGSLIKTENLIFFSLHIKVLAISDKSQTETNEYKKLALTLADYQEVFLNKTDLNDKINIKIPLKGYLLSKLYTSIY